MSGTQQDIGILPDNHAKYDDFAKPSEADYRKGNFLSPTSPISGAPRKSSKSATYPWTADVPVNASKVKSSDVKPID